MPHAVYTWTQGEETSIIRNVYRSAGDLILTNLPACTMSYRSLHDALLSHMDTSLAGDDSSLSSHRDWEPPSWNRGQRWRASSVEPCVCHDGDKWASRVKSIPVGGCMFCPASFPFLVPCLWLLLVSSISMEIELGLCHLTGTSLPPPGLGFFVSSSPAPPFLISSLTFTCLSRSLGSDNMEPHGLKRILPCHVVKNISERPQTLETN